MGLYQDCKDQCHKIDHDFLQFAPCPPPFLSYKEFREHALSRNLAHLEVCSISRRCRPADPDVEEYCKDQDETPNVVIIISVVCAVSVLVACIIIVYLLRRRHEKKNKNEGAPQDDVQNDDMKGIGQSPDIPLTEEHNRREGSYKTGDSNSNDTLDSETGVGRVLEHSDQTDGNQKGTTNTSENSSASSSEHETKSKCEDKSSKSSHNSGHSDRKIYNTKL